MGNMSGAEGKSFVTNSEHTQKRKHHMASSVVSMDDGDRVSFEENVASFISQNITEKINTLGRLCSNRSEDTIENNKHLRV